MCICICGCMCLPECMCICIYECMCPCDCMHLCEHLQRLKAGVGKFLYHSLPIPLRQGVSLRTWYSQPKSPSNLISGTLSIEVTSIRGCLNSGTLMSEFWDF